MTVSASRDGVSGVTGVISMRGSRIVFLAAAMMLGVSVAAGAQEKPKPKQQAVEVPQSHLPPPGLCRIWLNDVPAAQQPAPTDCASAVRNRPRNGRVIFNDKDASRGLKLPVKSLAPTPPTKPTDPPKTDPPPRKPKPDRP